MEIINKEKYISILTQTYSYVQFLFSLLVKQLCIKNPCTMNSKEAHTIIMLSFLETNFVR